MKVATLNSDTTLAEKATVSLHPAHAEGQRQGKGTNGNPDTHKLNASDGAKMSERLIESVVNQADQAAATRGSAELPTEGARTLMASENEGDENVGLDLGTAGRNASDRFKRCISEIAANQWDAAAWQAAVAEAQLGRSGGTPARDVCVSHLSTMLAFRIEPTS